MIEITKEKLRQIGVPGLLAMALLWLTNEYRHQQSEIAELRLDIRELRQSLVEAHKSKDAFVEMIADRYMLPLTK